MSFVFKRNRRLVAGLIASILGVTCISQSALANNHLSYAGVNLSGAEFNPKKVPGSLNKDYRYPGSNEYGYFAQKGMNIVRLPILWERLQTSLNAPLNEDQLNMIRQAVAWAKYNGQHIIIDIHNYAMYNGSLIGSSNVPVSAFTDLWRKLAYVFQNDDAVIFGIMNEPYGITADQWIDAAQQAVNAIRRVGAQNLILVPGTDYTGAHSWFSQYNGGSSNAAAFARFHDPSNRTAIEVHQYLDNDYSGTSGQCISPTVGADKLAGFTNWLRQTGNVAFLAEFAAGNNEVCNQALEGMLSYIEQNSDVFLGWTWWAAGAWWNKDYPFNILPNPDNSEKPQISILAPHSRAITR